MMVQSLMLKPDKHEIKLVPLGAWATFSPSTVTDMIRTSVITHRSLASLSPALHILLGIFTLEIVSRVILDRILGYLV